MFRELACYSQDSTYAEILEAVFTSSEKDMRCLAIPSGFMGRLSEFTKSQEFSVAIDFPYGLNGTQIRIHEIILAIRQGASYIDLVINNSFIKEENWRKIQQDLKSCLSICNEYDIELRVIIEYRLFSVKTVLLMCDLFYQAGVTHIINATGFIADDISDNAIISYQMHEKTGVLVTSCVRAFNKSHVAMFEEMGVHALRFMSSKVVGDIL
tara:strand:+ start:2747 stop:3379 length:633 start_codon:yes stop_codon:yes gene_type:complete